MPEWNSESWGTVCKKCTGSQLGASQRLLTNTWASCIFYPIEMGTASAFNEQGKNKRNILYIQIDQTMFLVDLVSSESLFLLKEALCSLQSLLRYPFFPEVYESLHSNIIYLPCVEL